MYIVYDLYQNEDMVFSTIDEAIKCYNAWKQTYYDDGWLPDECDGEIIVIAEVFTSAIVVEDDKDDETGEQLYRFKDVSKQTEHANIRNKMYTEVSARMEDE